jgi:DNA-binding transcriptional regulator YiaG
MRRKRNNNALGGELRAWRKTLRLSQSGAALQLQISTRTLQNWEQGRREPKGFALRALRETISRS